MDAWLRRVREGALLGVITANTVLLAQGVALPYGLGWGAAATSFAALVAFLFGTAALPHGNRTLHVLVVAVLGWVFAIGSQSLLGVRLESRLAFLELVGLTVLALLSSGGATLVEKSLRRPL